MWHTIIITIFYLSKENHRFHSHTGDGGFIMVWTQKFHLSGLTLKSIHHTHFSFKKTKGIRYKFYKSKSFFRIYICNPKFIYTIELRCDTFQNGNLKHTSNLSALLHSICKYFHWQEQNSTEWINGSRSMVNSIDCIWSHDPPLSSEDSCILALSISMQDMYVM